MPGQKLPHLRGHVRPPVRPRLEGLWLLFNSYIQQGGACPCTILHDVFVVCVYFYYLFSFVPVLSCPPVSSLPTLTLLPLHVSSLSKTAPSPTWLLPTSLPPVVFTESVQQTSRVLFPVF